MKLLFCKNCQDVFKLHSEPKRCNCGATGGQYLNDLDAIYWGNKAVPLVFGNETFAATIREWPVKSSVPAWKRLFDAATVPSDCKTYKKVSDPSKARHKKIATMPRKGLGHSSGGIGGERAGKVVGKEH